MDIIEKDKQQQKQKFLQKLSTLYVFQCDLERQKYFDSNVQLLKDKIITIQKITKGTFFRVADTTYNFIITHQRLSGKLNAGGVIDDSMVKLSKKELKQNQIVQFEFPLIKAVYANAQLIERGKLSLVVQDPENPREKTMKILIHEAGTEALKKFCTLFETLAKENKKKKEESQSKRDEYLNKRKEKVLSKRAENEQKNRNKFEQKRDDEQVIRDMTNNDVVLSQVPPMIRKGYK
ncbi:hypothetical protein OXYTRIMIC_061 [Oxytricha trifallax]|uniref:Uncharacterized protein n=1 Tax=Oxytricha trifallax TaxID=1172189 RepID=A0A073ICE3_9SPIT|nr:hypothetical protein OXYTRIMIC_061 [Oxytricha trifallax]